MAGPMFVHKETSVARSSYQYEKRRKELAKKKKNEEKRERKLAKKNPPVGERRDSAPGGEDHGQLGLPSPPLTQQGSVEGAPCAPNLPEELDRDPSTA